MSEPKQGTPVEPDEAAPAAAEASTAQDGLKQSVGQRPAEHDGQAPRWKRWLGKG